MPRVRRLPDRATFISASWFYELTINANDAAVRRESKWLPNGR